MSDDDILHTTDGQHRLSAMFDVYGDSATIGNLADHLPPGDWVEVSPGTWARKRVLDITSETEGDEDLGHHRRGAPDGEPEQERPHHADDGA